MTGPRVLWQRRADPSTHIWVRPDDVVAVGDELVELRTGRTRTEAPSSFLALAPWSHQRWEPWIVPIGAQAPRGEVDLCDARVWRGLLVVAKRSPWRGRGVPPGVLVEAAQPTTGEVAWQHRATEPEDLAMWYGFLTAVDGVVVERPLSSHYGHGSLRYPDVRTGRCRWSASWETATWRPDPAADDGKLVIAFHDRQPAVGAFTTGSGRCRWRAAVPAGTLPVLVRATARHVVVCAFPENTNRRVPRISHGPIPPVRLVGACECPRPRRGPTHNTCGQCEGFLRPWMTISVLDRASGAELWSHRWPWHNDIAVLAGIQALAIAAAGGDPVVVTQEEDVLHARRLDDGARLWSRPVAGIGMPSGLRRSGMPHAFKRIVHPHPGWVWLQEASGSVAEGTRTSVDVLLDPATGESLRLTDVFHVGRGEVTLAWNGETLTAHALPG